jgi:hypothetical protein
MKWLVSIFVGLCAAPLAAIIVGTAADFWAAWLRMPSRDGAPGYWVVMMALLAAVVAATLGISIARGWLLATPNFWNALGATLGFTVAVTFAITGLVWLAADLPPKVDGAPAPTLTREQQEADADAQQQAALLSLAADAPLAEWLVFTRYGVPQPRIDAAIATIRARPNYAADMTHEMLEGKYESSRDALRAVEHISPPPTELADGIVAVGKEIAQSLRNLEKESGGSDAYNERVAAISTRFSAWMVATRALQDSKVADFVPQLQEIIEPARRLDQAHVIRVDVVRVASFYLEKWAGIVPLPTDPPPGG